MAKAKMDLSAFVGKLLEEQDGDTLREGIRVLAQALMESEVSGLIGAERYERNADRSSYRNGYRAELGHTYDNHRSSVMTHMKPKGSDMKTSRAKTLLALLVLLAMPITMQAFERGTVERFATLPAGEAHPEGICVDREGNVYVVTVAANKPDTSGGTLIVFNRNGKHLRTV